MAYSGSEAELARRARPEVTRWPGWERLSGIPVYWYNLGTVTAVALMGRLLLLGSAPLWRDEAFNGVVIRRSLPTMLDIVRHDSAPPLSFLLARLFTVFGPSPFTLRLPSAMAGAAGVVLAAALGRRIGGDRAGLWAAVVMAAIPWFFLSSLNARTYALATVLVMAAGLTLWRALEKPSPGRLAAYAGCVALALYSHYLAALGITAQLVAAAVVMRPGFRTLLRAGLAAGAGVAVLVPWLVAAIPQFQHATSHFWVKPTDLLRFRDAVAQFITGPEVPRHAPRSDVLRTIQGLTVIGGGLAILALARLLYRGSAGQRRMVVYLVGSGLLSVLLLLVVSLRTPLFDARYAGVGWGVMVPPLGAGLAALRWRAVPVLAVLLMAVPAAILGLNQNNPDIPRLMAPLAGQVGSRDEVALAGALQYFPVAYYGDAELVSRVRIVAGSVPWFDGTAAFPPGVVAPAPPAVRGRIFVITDATRAPMRMPAGFVLRGRRCVTGFCLETYSR